MPTVSVAPGSDPRLMTQFTEMGVPTRIALARVIVLTAWSPIVWTGGQRAKANFQHSDFCALDFDDGKWTLGDATTFLLENKLIGIIGTTRSHQKAKDGAPAVDRFRIVMPWAGRILEARTYEQNMARLMAHMPADRACKDAGRFFWPCGRIAFATNGDPLAWLPYAPPPPRALSRTAAIDAELRRVPLWMRDELSRGVPPGQRNKTAYRFACHLKQRGFSQRDVEDILVSGIDIDRSELAGAISSAFRRN